MNGTRAVVGVLGPLWLFLLYATPSILANPQEVPPLDSAYAYVSAGMLAGIALAVLLGDRIPSKPYFWVGVTGFALGFAMALILFLPEFYCYQLSASSGSEFDVAQLRSLSLFGCAVADSIEWIASSALMHNLLMFANGVFACFSWLAIGFSCSIFFDCGYEESASGDPDRFNRVIAFVVALVFLVGFLRPGVWSAFAGAVADYEWLGSAPELCDLLPGFVFIGICAASCSIAWNLANATRARGTSEMNCLKWMLASYPLGQLLWNLVSRCTDVAALFSKLAGFEGPLVLLLTAAIVAAFVYLIMHANQKCISKEMSDKRVDCLLCREENGKAGEECATLSNEIHALQRFLEKKSMTQREIQATVLTLDGRTSGDVAEELGLKSPTVRNYLQRAYKKLGVGNITELRALLDSEGLLSQVQNSESLDAVDDVAVRANEFGKVDVGINEHREHVVKELEEIEVLALLFVITALCSRLCLRADSWVVLHSASLGLGLGIVALGVLLLVKDGFGFRCGGSGLRVAQGMDCLIFGVFALTLLAIQSYQPSFFQGQTPYGPVFMCVGVAACSFTSLRMVFRVAKRHREHSLSVNSEFSAAAIVVGITLCGVSAKTWAACCLIALLVIQATGFSVALLAFSSCVPASAAAPRERRSLFLPEFAAAFAMGIVAVEVFRGASDVFALIVQMTFLVAAIGIVSWKQASTRDWSRTAVLLSVLLVYVACKASLEIALTLILFLLIGIVATRRRGELSEDVRLCAGALGFGVGMITGCLLVDKWRDLIQLNPYAMEEYGGEVAAYLTIPSVVLTAVVIGLVAFWYVVSLDGMPIQEESEKRLAARMKMYMQSQGLSEPESEVLSQIALGLTGVQIAHKTHYSYGAVNTMRAGGYRKLGVHSKSELSNYLSENVTVSE